MIHRRNLLAGAIAAPFLAAAFRPAAAQSAVELLDVDDVEILGLSPDASILVGRLNLEQLVFLDAETLEELSTTDVDPAFGDIEEQSVTWNGAGTHIAFSLASWLTMIDSDIYTVEATTGEVINLTPGDPENRSLLNNSEALIDLYPTWIDDETLVFGRHQYLDETIACDLYTITTGGGEPAHLVDLAAGDILYVSAPITPLSDGRFVTLTDTADRRGAVTIIDPAGAIERPEMPFEPRPDLIDANDTHCIVTDLTTPGSIWMVPYDDPTAALDIYDVFELEPTAPLYSFPIFGPEAESIVWVAGSEPAVMIRDADGVRRVASFPEGQTVRRTYWSQTTVVLTGTSTWRVDTA